MTQAFSGKTAIVTGASSGIGLATALNLAKAGGAVAFFARRRDRLDELVSKIAAKGATALAVAGDASSPADIDSLMDQVLDWQEGERKVDIVVVNARRAWLEGYLTVMNPSGGRYMKSTYSEPLI
ncbi:MAG: SDR family NAD(P)-dependent oxidoreductase [Syntrophobacteraceae bacterium]